jgi:molybdopterin synthase catalytic subunit
MDHVTQSAIDVGELIKAAEADACGGIAIFLGTVRAGAEDGPVQRIEYSGYEEMLQVEFGRITSEALERWPGVNVRSVHRLGSVPTGEASIAVVVAAPHRGEAFAACEFVVEEAKKRLPVWKKEIFADGRESWRANRVDATGKWRSVPESRRTARASKLE